MNKLVILTLILLEFANCENSKACITRVFNQSCKIQLYACFNNSDCSYQLHTNTMHVVLNDQDTIVPLIYFSNPFAVALHKCLNRECKIGQIDNGYLKQLPGDYCVMQVWDICGGNVQEVYLGKSSQPIMQCYHKLCPNLQNQEA